ncbi:thioredoxin domain-containing protein [Polymorphospora sp. NPDC050346]|uniref:DsbA family protein n=1 Tax=Polymorphospora sp. NPDC050346 TaxID=3155780 RepID=UPI0033E4EEBF
MATNNAKARKRTAKPATGAGRTQPARPTPTGTGAARTAARKTATATKATRKIRKTGMSTNLKVTLGVLAVALAVVVGIVVVNRSIDIAPVAASEALVRADSHRLSTAADGKTTVVEFLDFECESCLAAYPGVEQLRAEYGDRITYVVRYFPIASHPNAYNAAHAAEAAARQGAFEQMYKKLFDTQTIWGHNQQSQAPVFEGYAQEMGLDMARFRADVASAEVVARVKADAADGQALGVRGTPTFFINGQRFDGRPDYNGLKTAIDRSLNS